MVAGAAGLAASYAVAMVMSIRESPVVAVTELVIRLTPGRVVEQAIDLVGQRDKPLLVAGILVLLVLLFAWAGHLARTSWWRSMTLVVLVSALGGVAVAVQRGSHLVELLPVVVGFVTWTVCLSVLVESLRGAERLEAVASQVDAPEWAIFNFHCPPYDTQIDQGPVLGEDLRMRSTAGGVEMHAVGSTACRGVIERYQPLLGFHGHLHESRGTFKLGRTVCINPGSEYSEGVLRGAIVDVNVKKQKLKSTQLVSG